MQDQLIGFPVTAQNLPKLQYKRVYISSAQIFSLFTTPVIIFPGIIDRFIHIERVTVYREPGVAYIGTTGLFTFRLNATPLWQFTQAQTVGSAGPYKVLGTYPSYSTWDISAFLNKDWDVKLVTGDPTPGTGTNGLILELFFSVWDAALSSWS